MAAAEHLITANLDIWSSAIKSKSAAGRGKSNKLELYGVKKLRELILELAVSGLLVPQDPNDEPASELLENIAAEKAKLVKDGKIKKQKALPAIGEDEKPYQFPESWAFCRLGDALNVLNGRAYKKHEMLSEGTPLLRVGNLFTSNEWYYSDLELEPEKYIDTGDLIYAWSASFGPFIWDGGKAIYHYHIWKLDFYHEQSLNKNYVLKFLQAITESIKASGHGIAMVHMTKERMEKLVMPVPPLPEQRRIVAKVDELMALCDQLEQQQETSITAHQTLVQTLLDTLTTASERDGFTDAWARIADHFDTLFTTEWSIDQLKQTILQLAVMGKLVPQDPDDEPASELLKKIAAEKAKLLKDGKIKKQKALPPIDEDEKLFEVPGSWEWVPWGEILAFDNAPFKRGPFGSSLKKDMFVESGYKVYEQYCPINDDCSFERYYITDKKYEELKGFAVKARDYLVSCSGVTLGRITQVPEDFKEGIINQALLRVRINHEIVDDEFFKFLFRSPFFQKAIFANSTGSAIPNVKGVKELKVMPVPLLPIKEQVSIVAKLEELMALCDTLKTSLNSAQATQLQLADAMAERAVA